MIVAFIRVVVIEPPADDDLKVGQSHKWWPLGGPALEEIYTDRANINVISLMMLHLLHSGNESIFSSFLAFVV